MKEAMTTTAIPERQTEWKAPTGRWLRPRHTFEVEGQGTTKFLFSALVLAKVPYVEAFELDAKRGERPVPQRFRCFRPEAVKTVSNKPLEDPS